MTQVVAFISFTHSYLVVFIKNSFWQLNYCFFLVFNSDPCGTYRFGFRIILILILIRILSYSYSYYSYSDRSSSRPRVQRVPKPSGLPDERF